MAARVWLLVEWVDDSDVFPAYGLVNVDSLAYDDNELQPGNVIYLQVKHDNPKRAKILRISENKQYVREHKEILERQDQKFKNVLQMCMRTLKEIKTENSDAHQATNRSALPHVVVASNADSGSDSELESKSHKERNRIKNAMKFEPKYPPQHSYTKEPRAKQFRALLNTSQQRRQSMVSSTPLPHCSKQKHLTLCFDQATQTEGPYLQPPTAKIEEMEAVLKSLYRRFQNLIAQVNVNPNGSSMSESENNDDASYLEAKNGDSWAEQNNTLYSDQDHAMPNQDGAEQVVEDAASNQLLSSSNSNVKLENVSNPNTLRVRRMSAQTTNNIETMMNNSNDGLVPIGNGNAKVPARLLNDIDWHSHTTATRQLLQAVFPRSVLATHSLTGKKSPAFMNRPPKKILDPKMVEDIVKIVSLRCGVPNSLVRSSITIKCTDEAKLYRNRQQYKLQRKINDNDENRPPSTPSSDESTNVIN